MEGEIFPYSITTSRAVRNKSVIYRHVDKRKAGRA